MIFLISASGVLGFLVSFYIWYKKNKKQPLVCLVGGDCNVVLQSKYARTFGLRNEVIGMVYYVGVILGTVLWWSGVLIPAWIMAVTLIASILAVLFSLYLIVIQAVVLKRWCSWCLLSALANGVIAVSLITLSLRLGP